jgi:hypothetical protein
MELANNLYYLTVSNRLIYKNMLWNIDNLKPEIRSDFQARIFNAWRSIYMTSIRTDPVEDFPEFKKLEPLPLTAADVLTENGEQEQTRDITEQYHPDSEKQKRVASREDRDSYRKEDQLKKQSVPAVPKASTYQFENDWLDKLLDFFPPSSAVCWK